MKVLIADQKLVTEVFTVEEAIATMRQALTMLADGDVVMSLRTMLSLPQGDAVAGLMPAYLGGIEAGGVIEDLASAHRIYEIARERGLGTWIEIGGRHFGKAVER